MPDENSMMSKKLIVTMLVTVICGVANILETMESLHAAAAIGGTAMVYVGGQALIDAVGKFAAAKFGAGK